MDIAKTIISYYLSDKADADLNEDDIAKALGYKSRATLKAKRDDPLSFTIGDLIKLADLFGWSIRLRRGGNAFE